MIHLTYSNRTEGLLAALARDLAAARFAPGASPLDPAFLVVPNGNVETYLRQGLARLTGIAANLEVHQLRRFVGRLADGALGGEGRLLDAHVLRGLLLSVLLDRRRLAAPDLERVRAWLEAGGATPEAIDRRRVELSRELARLFEEYAFSRPDLLAAWGDGPTLHDGPFAAVEAWQRLLFREVGERLAGRGRERPLWLPELLDRMRAADFPLPPRIHLFGISYVASVFQRLLAALAERTEVHLYTLNPCLEFWEDVETGREVARRLPRRGEGRRGPGVLGEGPDPYGLTEPGDTPALVAWGRPGRENVRLLDDLAGCDFRAAFTDPGDGTLLAALQRDILFRAPERTVAAPGAFADDRSVAVLACPGVRREAELIASEIWRLVREDAESPAPDREPLRFHDVAVLVAGRDPDLYFTHLAAAFLETGDIPFSLSDASLAGESRVAEAIGLLLALPGGRFLRRELLALATHPRIAGRFRELDPARWLDWCESLGIVHGADRSDHRGTYLERDVLNWDQGLRRLALGAFLAGARSGEDGAFALGAERYLPEELGASEAEGAAAFALLVRSLIADARWARDAVLTLPDWADFLVRLVRTYVHAGDEAERAELDRCARALAGIGELDVDGARVSFRIAAELAAEALSGLGGGKGQYLASGVAISGLQPMRAIPFRVIFVAGLGEGRFPAGDRRSQLDLRQATPRAGDVSPREGDRYLFLETLLSARDRLVLSYVARDELTGETLEPSSVVSELLTMLRGYVGDEGVKALEDRHPLRRHHPRYFPALFGEAGRDAPAPAEARREAQALALRGVLEPVLGAGRIEAGDALAAVAPAQRARLAERLGLPPPPDAPGAEPAVVRLSLSAVRRFLECPLQGGALHLLGLDDRDEEDVLAREDEPFALPSREVGGHLRAWFLAACAEAAAVPPEDVLLRHLEAGTERLALAGHGPTGVFGDAQRVELAGALGAWAAQLGAAVPGAGPPRIVRFGRAEEHEQVDRLEDPIVLEVPGVGGPVRVELVGRTEPLLGEAATSLILGKRGRKSGVWEPVRQSREALRGFLDHVVLAALGGAAAPHRILLLNAADPKGPATVDLAPLGGDEARAWLASVVADMLSGVHGYLLPCEVAFVRADPKYGGFSVEEAVEFVLEHEHSHASAYGPVPHPERRPVPPEAEARQRLERRFGLFFRLRGGRA